LEIEDGTQPQRQSKSFIILQRKDTRHGSQVHEESQQNGQEM